MSRGELQVMSYLAAAEDHAEPGEPRVGETWPLTCVKPHRYHPSGSHQGPHASADPLGTRSMKATDLTLNRSRWSQYEEDHLESGGYPIVLSIWPARPRRGPDRGALVFAPGTGDHPLLYMHFMEGLAAAGHSVVGIHFAGTGKSPRTGLGYRWDTFKQNVRDAVAYTRKRFPGPVGLIGSSQGGLLIQQMAAELEDIDVVICHNIGVPAEAESIILTKIPNFLRPIRWLPQSLIGLTSRLFPDVAMPLGVYLNEDGIFTDPELGRINRQDPIKNRYLPYRFFWSFITSRPARPVEELRVPTLVLAGEEDEIFPIDYIRQNFQRIGSLDKELVVFPGRGHMVMVEATEESLAPTLRWLNARRGG